MRRLSLSLLIMLGFAGLELSVGWFAGLAALTADGLHMLAHSVHLGVALVMQALALMLTTRKRLLTENIGGLCIAGFLIGTAFMVASGFGHHGHHHADDGMCISSSPGIHAHGEHDDSHHNDGGNMTGFLPGQTPPDKATHQLDGIIMMVVGILSLLVHAWTGRILFHGRESPLVHGACIYIISHTLMAGAIIISGLLLAVTGWQGIDQWLSYAIAVFMLLGGLRLAWSSGRKLYATTV